MDFNLECPVCYLPFTDEDRRPLMLECGHSFCSWCIGNVIEIYNHCPTCRREIDQELEDIPVNHSLLQIVNLRNSTETNSSTNDRIKSEDELQNKCLLHETETIQYYCKIYNFWLCQQCIIVHTDHEADENISTTPCHISVDEALSDMKTKYHRINLDNIRKMKRKMESVDYWKDNIKRIREDLDQIVNDSTKRVEKQENILNKTEMMEKLIENHKKYIIDLQVKFTQINKEVNDVNTVDDWMKIHEKLCNKVVRRNIYERSAKIKSLNKEVCSFLPKTNFP